MEALAKVSLVGFGGFLGANLRYWFGAWLGIKLGGHFPWSTFLINVSGSLLIGVILELALRRDWGVDLRLFIATGLLGGYTTFSTFSYEAVSLMAGGKMALSALYMASSAICSVAGAFAGAEIAALLVPR